MDAERILVVDDEKELADLVALYLKNEGYQVFTAYSGSEALDCVARREVDLAVLDVMLPDVDGFTICRKIREQRFFPIIMLTAKVDDGSKILGLTLGADDYITKPFNPLEVTARVRTQLRRYKHYNGFADISSQPKKEYDIRGLLINCDTHACSLYGRDLRLTPTEFAIVLYLCKNQGRVVPSEELFEAVWREKYMRNSNNTVMAHIGRIREKLGQSSQNAKLIETIWGVGYEIR